MKLSSVVLKSSARELINIFKRWSFFEALCILTAKLGNKIGLRLFADLYEEERKYLLIRLSGYSIKRVGKWVLLKNSKSNFKGIFLRRFSSDYHVFKQVFIDDDFKIFLSTISRNSEIKTMIDAGANIGVSSLKFHLEFDGLKIFPIEPDKGNFKTLQRNLEYNQINAIPVRAAVWSHPTTLYFDRTFRDMREWAIAVTEIPNEGEKVRSISINEIVEHNNLQSIDILKIDVEGSEKEIFANNDERIAFLDITKNIAIELHEELGVSESITHLLKEKGFILRQSGEYLIGQKNI